MLQARRRLRAAAFLFASLAAVGTATLAQETSNTVGPPVLKDFQLKGEVTTPRPTTATPPPAAAAQPAPRPSAQAPAAERRPDPRPAATTRPTARQTARPAPVIETPAAPPPATATPSADVAPLPQPATPSPAPVSAPADVQGSGISSLWAVAAGAALLALAFLALRFRRRRRETEVEETRTSAREQLGDALVAREPAPKPAPKPRPEPEVAAAAAARDEQPRAWLEIDIAPDRAAATDTEATVDYALTMRNRGNAIARNIRIEARLFNANAEADIAAFFQSPMRDQSGSPHVTIAPDGHLTLMGQVSMPKADVREIEVKGLRIFVPMVAITIAYDWGANGAGRTSRSWLVGREAQTPSAKMGAFRLDLGPRIYRSVGQREGKLVMV